MQKDKENFLQIYSILLFIVHILSIKNITVKLVFQLWKFHTVVKKHIKKKSYYKSETSIYIGKWIMGHFGVLY